MGRKRMVHPEFFLSDDIAALSVQARLTFIGLWCYFDDDGRGKDSAAAVRASVWGMDPDLTVSNVADLLDEIETVGALCRYELDDERYMHSPTWEKWQTISHPADPRIPPCPEHGGRPAKRDGRGKKSPRTTETLGSSTRTTAQVVSVVSQINSGSESSEDCEHGVDRYASCTLCPSLRVVGGRS